MPDNGQDTKSDEGQKGPQETPNTSSVSDWRTLCGKRKGAPKNRNK
jgi:hypothetical protein